MHVLCTTKGQTNDTGLAIYKPLKIYVLRDEDMETVLKTFKFEAAEVRSHFQKQVDVVSAIPSTPEIKRKAAMHEIFASPGWSSPPRSLKATKNDDAASVGVRPHV